MIPSLGFAAKRLLKFTLFTVASTRRISSMEGLEAAQKLSEIKLAPVQNGAIVGEQINAGSLWSDGPALVYVVRRPG
jgi:hypothetical protein